MQRVSLGRAGHLYRQRQARQLAAGGHLGQRPQRLAGVGGDAEFDLVQAMRLRLGGGVRAHFDLEATARHAQRLHARGDFLAEGARPRWRASDESCVASSR